MSGQKQNLTINLKNLPALAANEQYEGWLMVNGTPTSTGTFVLDGSGKPATTAFKIGMKELKVATDFILTIEPLPDNDPAPSMIKVLGGVFEGKSANVSVSHAAALGADFSAAKGKYILATPTTSSTEDELSGVWFLDLSGASPTAGLNLPPLPAEWLYEGWVVIDGMPVSTGTFKDTNKADNAAPYSGSDAPGPPFPGEDFITNAPAGLIFPTNLSGRTVVVSIEPNPDNAPEPFAFKPLVATVPENAMDHETYNLNNQVSSNFPYGTVTKK